MSRHQHHLPGAAVFLAALILIFATLFLGDNITLGDNGDFFRIIDLASMELDAQRNGLIALEEGPLWKNLLTVLTDTENLAEYPTSHILPVRLSVLTNLIANALLDAPVRTYRISHLAVIYGLLYAAALAFTLTGIRTKKRWQWWSFSGISLVILCDVGYVSYFASFYGEALQHILLVLSVGFLIRAAYQLPRPLTALAGFGAMFLFGISKPFNIPVAALLCCVYLMLILLRTTAGQRLRAIAMCTAAVCLLVYFMAIIPNWMGSQTNYNAVFYGILRDTDEETSREYLEELGLDPEMAELRNSHFYVSDIFLHAQEHDIYSPGELSYMDLALFYLRHPLFTFGRFPTMMAFSGSIRNTYFLDSNLAAEPGRMNLWSWLRERTGFDTIAVNLTVVILFFALLWLSIPKKKSGFPIPPLIFLGLAYSMILPYVSNGEADLAKHMFLFIEIIDLMLLFVLLRALQGRRQLWASAALIAAVLLSSLPLPSQPETVRFGGLEWYVVEETGDSRTLLCAEAVDRRCYDADNRNEYASSDIRQWLNGPFLESLTPEEQAQLMPQTHKVIHSVADKPTATEGDRDFGCIAYPALAADNYDRAYGSIQTDLVTLPSAELISRLTRQDLSVTLDQDYWLETPYFNNGSRVRFLGDDGMIYFADAAVELAIRPVICIRK